MDTNVQSAGGRNFVPLNQSLPQLPNKSERENVPRRSCNLATVKVFYYAIAASFAAILSGCTLSFPSSAVLDLTDSEPRPDFKFDVRLSDVFGLLGPLGALFGGLMGGLLTDYLGRKPSLMLVVLPHFFGYLAMAYAHMSNHPVVFKMVLMLGRFSTGVGLGWTTLVSPVFIAEIAPAKLRGMLTFFVQLLLSIGLVVVFLLGTFPTFKYYDAALVIAGMSVISMLLVLPAPETPRWLLVHGQRTRAIIALKSLRGEASDITVELCEIENDIAKTRNRNNFSEVLKMLFSRATLIPLSIIVCALFFQQFSGILAATTYSSSIFKSAGVKNYRLTSTYASGAIELLFTVIAVFIVDTCGRKLLLIASGLGGFVATLMMGVHFFITRPSLCNHNSTSFETLSNDVPDINCNSHYAPLAIVSLMLFFSAFTIGWGPIPGILLGELLPLRVRGVASGAASCLNWSFAVLVAGTYLNFTKLLNPWVVWWGYSVINLASVVFVIVFVFETKGKSLEEIEERFRRHKCLQRSVVS